MIGIYHLQYRKGPEDIPDQELSANLIENFCNVAAGT